jgi:hypothetical protein
MHNLIIKTAIYSMIIERQKQLNILYFFQKYIMYYVQKMAQKN